MRGIHVLAFLPVIFFLLTGTAWAQIDCPYTLPDSPTDEDVLKNFYCETDGSNWMNNTGWGSGNTEDKWHGVVFNEQRKVVELKLHNNRLSGSIPSELGNLNNLESLQLYNSELSGEIPSELGNLSNLAELHLYNNELSGEIPSELGNLNNLESLQLYNNELSGEIPSELGNLSNLAELYLDDNSLSGEIPSELGNLNKLVKLHLYHNSLSGEIPSELGNLTSLVQLYLHNNELSGEIPSELGNLTSLLGLFLNNNELSGEIPSELGNLTSLLWLYLNSNELSGEILSELGNLTSLAELFLYSNQLSGSIPSELGKLSNLVWLHLDHNQLSGGIPSELGNLNNLVVLHLNNNRLSGSIPSELGNLSNLESLQLDQNQLNGSIPVEMGKLTRLTELYLHSNQLSGGIPSELGNLNNLAWLLLNDNQLSGSIPSELGNLTSPRGLYLDHNNLTGSIPSELGRLTGLQRLLLNDNQLSGSIPSELGNLSSLRVLWLHHNQLTGSIPDLSALTFLTHLLLNNNKLSGNVPASVSSITSLIELSLWSNPALAQPTDPSLFPKIDRAALRSIYSDNSGGLWINSEGWFSGVISSAWHGVTVDSKGLVTGLDLRNNNLRGTVAEAFSGLPSLDTLILSGNRDLIGELPAELMDLTDLSILDVMCTGVSVPDNQNFRDWLSGISFTPSDCTPQQAPLQPPPPPPPPQESDLEIQTGDEDELVISSKDIDVGLVVVSRNEEKFVITIKLSVEGDEEHDGVPSIIFSSSLLEKIETVTFNLSVPSEGLPEGLRLEGFAAEAGIGDVMLEEGETVTVCLPAPSFEDDEELMPRLYRYEEGWNLLSGSRIETVNGNRSVCADVSSFPLLFGVFVEIPEPAVMDESAGGCSVAFGGAGKIGSFNVAFNLFLIMFSLLGVFGIRRQVCVDKVC